MRCFIEKILQSAKIQQSILEKRMNYDLHFDFGIKNVQMMKQIVDCPRCLQLSIESSLTYVLRIFVVGIASLLFGPFLQPA